MKKSFLPAVLPGMSILMVVAALLVSVTGTPNSNYVASALASGNQSAAQSQPASPLGWTDAVDVSQDPNYDNTSSIGAAPSGAVTVGWEQRNYLNFAFNYIQAASNTTLGGNFTEYNTLQRSSFKQNGNAKVSADANGRRYVIWWQQDGTNVCDSYAVIGTNGERIAGGDIPGTCGAQMKGDALVVAPDGTMHILLGADNTNVNYFVRTPDGNWPVLNERITSVNRPTQLTVALSTDGKVMAGWAGLSPGGYYDIYTALRNGPNDWTIEDISYNCCSGCPTYSRTYEPSLAGDAVGGFRAAWADEQCDPQTDPRTTDLYYREWHPGNGWAGQPLVRVVHDPGQVYWTSIVVDHSNQSHIVFSDDSGRDYNNYTLQYVTGSGTVFTAPDSFLNATFGAAFAKEQSLAYSPGNIHVSFNSNRDDPNKETYYMRKTIADGGQVPTPTPVPQRCPGERFSDVCPGDYYYTATLSLVDAGVVSGYNTQPPCDSGQPCFKPFNNITRGQAAKIIVLGGNLQINQSGGPHFQDVPATDPFYSYVETAYNAGIITGYPCGAPGEPCGPGNLPYFRPGANVTRGQLSKMTSQAFGYNEAIPSTQQTYQDVAPNSTFWVYIERLTARGIMSGYNCGGTGEQCVPPANRPYFRPNNNMVRGQAVKIIYNARQLIPPTPTPSATPTSEATVTATATAVITGTVTPVSTEVATSTAVATSTSTEVAATATSTGVVQIPTETPTLPAAPVVRH